MLFHRQEIRHQPWRGVNGDCDRAALASVLELPLRDVPHFAEDSPPAKVFQARIEEWLNLRNLTCVMVPFAGELQHVLDALASSAPSASWFISGRTRSGLRHTVIGRRGRIVHDPGFEQGGVVQPYEDGFYWVTFLAAREPELFGFRVDPLLRKRPDGRFQLWHLLTEAWMKWRYPMRIV